MFTYTCLNTGPSGEKNEKTEIEQAMQQNYEIVNRPISHKTNNPLHLNRQRLGQSLAPTDPFTVLFCFVVV